ncbi:MAG TPA: hypothetical protein VLA90_09805 [Actinomycetota bacterium]|nr:hypothetical protein [Actinomycetota bacterium]
MSLTTWRTGTYVVVLSASGPGADASLSTAVDVHGAITDGS